MQSLLLNDLAGTETHGHNSLSAIIMEVKGHTNSSELWSGLNDGATHIYMHTHTKWLLVNDKLAPSARKLNGKCYFIIICDLKVHTINAFMVGVSGFHVIR